MVDTLSREFTLYRMNLYRVLVFIPFFFSIFSNFGFHKQFSGNHSYPAATISYLLLIIIFVLYFYITNTPQVILRNNLLIIIGPQDLFFVDCLLCFYTLSSCFSGCFAILFELSFPPDYAWSVLYLAITLLYLYYLIHLLNKYKKTETVFDLHHLKTVEIIGKKPNFIIKIDNLKFRVDGFFQEGYFSTIY